MKDTWKTVSHFSLDTLTLSCLQPRMYSTKSPLINHPWAYKQTLLPDTYFLLTFFKLGKKNNYQKHIWPEHWIGWAFNGSVRELKGRYQGRFVFHCSNGSNLVYLSDNFNTTFWAAISSSFELCCELQGVCCCCFWVKLRSCFCSCGLFFLIFAFYRGQNKHFQCDSCRRFPREPSWKLVVKRITAFAVVM